MTKTLTVADAIEILKDYPPETKLLLLDCDTSWEFPVSYIGVDPEEIGKLHGVPSFEITKGYVAVVSTNNYGEMLPCS